MPQVGYLLYPQLFALRRGRVRVETSAGALALGRTSLDRRLGTVAPAPNAFVAFEANAPALVAAFVEDLQTLLEAL